MIETDPEVESNSFPSSIVEQTWNTFFELGFYYRASCEALFPDKFLFPESAITSLDNIGQVAKRYSETLVFYQDIFQEEPSRDFWESVEQRFPDAPVLPNGNDEGIGSMEEENEEKKIQTGIDDPNKRIAVNIYRLVAAKAIKSIVNAVKGLEYIIYQEVKEKEYFQQFPERTGARSKFKSAK